MERKGIIAAGNMLVDHVHQIVQWPERGWLAEITHSERSTGGAPLNVLLTLAKMHVGLPLQAVGLIGEDGDGDYILAMLDQYHVNRQRVQRTTFAPTSMSQVMTDPSGQRTFFHSPGANRLLDLPAFDRLDGTMKIFHLGYLLLLDSLDMPDDEFGTRSARCWPRCATRDMKPRSTLSPVRATRAISRWCSLLCAISTIWSLTNWKPASLAAWRCATATMPRISPTLLKRLRNYWRLASGSAW
jgi:hypothetical protein